MTKPSAAFDQNDRAQIAIGDVVCTSPDRLLRFTVLAVRGDKAWVRDLDSGSDHLAATSRCRRIGS